MIRDKFLIVLASLAFAGQCKAQPKTIPKTMTQEKSNNPLLCDPETGFCEIPAQASQPTSGQSLLQEKTVRILYFTDPICSSCWGIEPQLRKLKLQYGDQIQIDYYMGGLLRDWSYNSGGISKPSDVAHHWDEVSAYYQMPIDGDVWLEDPLDSSYPPSIAFKAAQLQDPKKAVLFLRELRELVFLKKKNIARWENIELAAKNVGLDITQLKSDYQTRANALFQSDLNLAREYGVRGFPTFFVTGGSQQPETIYGFKPYASFESAVLKVNPKLQKAAPVSSIELFKIYPTLTTREFSELSDLEPTQALRQLEALKVQGKIIRADSKNGPIWIAQR